MTRRRSIRSVRAIAGLVGVAVFATACSEPRQTAPSKPPRALAAPVAGTALARIPSDELGFVAGETLVWEIRARGVALGRFELAVGADTIKSVFTTSGLASAVASIEHELVTSLEGHRPAQATERIAVDGRVRRFTTSLAGTASHTLHTALGTLRAWAQNTTSASAGFLEVVVADRLVRIELAAPVLYDRAVRVDGTVLGLEQRAALTIWFDAGHRFLRVEVRSGGELITATPAV